MIIRIANRLAAIGLALLAAQGALAVPAAGDTGPLDPAAGGATELFPLNDEIRLTKPWLDDWLIDGRSGLEFVGGQRIEPTPAAVVALAGCVMLGSAWLLVAGSRRGAITRKPIC